MAQRHTPISRGMNRFRLAAMAAKGTIEVCAANGSQASPRSRRRFASIDTVPAARVLWLDSTLHLGSSPTTTPGYQATALYGAANRGTGSSPQSMSSQEPAQGQTPDDHAVANVCSLADPTIRSRP